MNSKKLGFKAKWVRAITYLLLNYTLYGVNFQSNIFIHEYWYKKNKLLRTLPTKIYMQYYKRFFYTNSTLSIEHSFLIRKKTKEFFNFRPWVFLHNNWFIVIICWYKPPKPYLSNSIKESVSGKNISSYKARSSQNFKNNLHLRANIYKF